MILMTETDFVGHAVCDFLRDHLSNSEIAIISADLACGEPVGALQWALATAIDRRIALPPVYVEHIRALDVDNECDDFGELLGQLPKWSLVA